MSNHSGWFANKDTKTFNLNRRKMQKKQNKNKTQITLKKTVQNI